MKLRQANKILTNVVRGRIYPQAVIDAAFRRVDRTVDMKAANSLWAEVAPKLRAMMMAESETAYKAAEAMPMSEERIQEIVDYATGKAGWPGRQKNLLDSEWPLHQGEQE